MTPKGILRLVRDIFKGSWERHQRTLALICVGALRSKSLSLTAIGRELPTDTVPKHAIKRTDRWLGNRRFDDRRAREQLLRAVVGPRKRIYVAVDWTQMRKWPVLVAAVVHRGRAVPVLWSVAIPERLRKSQNTFEHGFFVWLATALPKGVACTVLLDRGFKRVSLVRHLRRCNLRFVIRTGGNTLVKSKSFKGKLENLVRRRGLTRDLPDATLTPIRAVAVRIVATWKAPAKEPWVIMTDLKTSPAHVFKLYAKRFRIEEAFRDQKDWRFGMELGYVKIRSAHRAERQLLLAALVLWIAMLIGAHARTKGWDKGYRANTHTKSPTHSDFTLGVYYALRKALTARKLLENFYLEGCRV